MALSWPLSLAEFFEDIPFEQTSFRPDKPQAFSRTKGGETIPHRIGTPLWSGEVRIALDRHEHSARIEAKLAHLQNTGASFLIYDRRKPFPTYDPDGTILGAATPTIASIESNNRDLSIAGLPLGYTLTEGDLIGWQYGSNPTRYALHRIVTGAVDGNLIEVDPFVAEGVTVGAPVQLIRPFCKAIVTSVDWPTGRGVISSGAAFRWQQTLR